MNTRNMALTATLVLAAGPACMPRGAAVDGHSPTRSNRAEAEVIEISLKAIGKDKTAIVVHGLTREQLGALASEDRTKSDWTKLFWVFTGQTLKSGQPVMLGDFSVREDLLIFEPRFPLQSGLTYTAVLNASQLPLVSAAELPKIERSFKIPKAAPAKPAQITAVFPTRDALPENQLKFYIHFSDAMSQVGSYKHIQLVRDDGQTIEFPFLELEQELWNRSGTRFTLFFDPGRIKRGLKPREQYGPALETGRSYTLVIAADWQSAQRVPLESEYRKQFTILDPDDTQPATDRWQMQTPSADSSNPLVLTFDEPLDHAMLNRVLVVFDERDQPMPGTVSVHDGETRWRFTPDASWKAGSYRLRIDAALEDLAGNSLGRPFEVDMFRSVEPMVKQEFSWLEFEIE